jgi:hypothetical protein
MPMGILDALVHALNFALPAWGVAMLGTALVRLVFRSAASRVQLARVIAVSGLAGTVALGAGLFLWERDGRMATYGLLIGAEAAVWWWMVIRAAAVSPATPRRRAKSGAKPG